MAPSLVDNGQGSLFVCLNVLNILNILNVLNVCLNAKCLEPLRWLRVWWIMGKGLCLFV